MSIYAQLLDDALGQSDTDKPSTTGEALAQLLEIRHRLGANPQGYSGEDWAPAAIADQLAYDVALIELSRRLGIAVNLAGFGQPKLERTRLEQALTARGVHLDDFDAATANSDQPLRRYGQRDSAVTCRRRRLAVPSAYARPT